MPPVPAPVPPARPRQRLTRVGGLTVAYADHGGDGGGGGVPLLALHGTFGRGAVFAGVAGRLAGRVRVIAPDQRGHGHTGRADDYGADAFVEDAAAFVRHLGLGPLPVLGHSRGGITAYQLAARHPELVSALLIEDVGPVMRRPEVDRPTLDVRGWPRTAPTREELGAAIVAAGVPDASYFLQSAEPEPEPGTGAGAGAGAGGESWRLLFDWDDMMAVQESGVGDWWPEWLGSRCPALVLRGGHSTMLPAPLAREMTGRRPDTRLVEFPAAGHWIHDDDPDGFAEAVAEFLGAAPVTVGGR